MTLRELLDALHKAPEETLDQSVRFFDENENCHWIDVVEAIAFGNGDRIEPFSVCLVAVRGLGTQELYPEDDQRIYLSKVKRRKGRNPRLG